MIFAVNLAAWSSALRPAAVKQKIRSSALDESLKLSRPASDCIILRQDNPTLISGALQPSLVADPLCLVLTVNGRKRVSNKTELGEFRRKDASAKAAVY